MSVALYNTCFSGELSSYTVPVIIIPHNVWYLNAININAVLASNDGMTYATTLTLFDGATLVATFNCVFNANYSFYEIANLSGINYASNGANNLTLQMNHADKLISPFYLAYNIFATYKP